MKTIKAYSRVKIKVMGKSEVDKGLMIANIVEVCAAKKYRIFEDPKRAHTLIIEIPLLCISPVTKS